MTDNSNTTDIRSLSLWQALTPVILLITMLGASVYYFSDNSSYGANQIALLIAAGVAAFIGMRNGHQWDDIEQGIIHGISNAMIAVLILLVVGSLIGTWMLAGTVQSLIYFGLQLISASWFYAAACLVCGIAAMSIGSSWTVAGTLGIAFMGMAMAMQLDLAIAAGAIISGAYFGDKLSPLSDTTNLASAVTGTPLFDHIQNLLWTTVPGFLIALCIFSIMGGEQTLASAESIRSTMTGLQANFNLGAHLLIPVVVVFVLAWRRVPALITLAAGALIGGLFAVLFQQEAIGRFISSEGIASAERSLLAVWTALFDGYVSETGNDALDSLLSRGGMSSMLNTVWLILCAMAFGSVMEKVGLLERILMAILSSVRSTTGLIVTTVFTCIGANVMTADQYIAIVLPGRMYKLEYARRGLASKNLSRTLEDAATLTSPLIPWNTCGAYMAGTLGVATLSYLPYAFFNLLGPVLCVAFAVAHFRIVPLESEQNA
ncbi:Na+/H+ antiporter NhaC [Bacterioplanoides pacificum]|uniref:Na+/H+ antiporter NhaC n=1 Tax=Bacterioplanoides pacificum TaxID=1171596 RepID=A0ABV7VQ82_9GAMM